VNVVREDPHVKRLLYAGTERGVHVSFDDGASWQPLSLNLPHTSARDLIVHGDDLAVATHGRGFWILDDVTPLRDLARGGPTGSQPSGAYLFPPQTSTRYRRSRNTDTPLPPEVPAGQNPPDGAIIDYYLPQAPSGGVTLEIATAAGRILRRYASTDRPAEPDEKELNVPMYWIRRPATLESTPGMHRFVWDVRTRPPGAIRREPPISAIPHDTPIEPLGVLVPPGQYVVRLTVDGRTVSRPLTLRMDPRIRTPLAALVEQYTVASKLAAAMTRTFEAWRGETDAARKRELASLNDSLTTIYELVEGTDAPPTAHAVQAAATALARVK
jgi:hypothetical protein